MKIGRKDLCFGQQLKRFALLHIENHAIALEVGKGQAKEWLPIETAHFLNLSPQTERKGFQENSYLHSVPTVPSPGLCYGCIVFDVK